MEEKICAIKSESANAQQNMASVKRTIRVGVFFVCLLLFFWQAYEIVKEYLEKEIATKVCDKKVSHNFLIFLEVWRVFSFFFLR